MQYHPQLRCDSLSDQWLNAALHSHGEELFKSSRSSSQKVNGTNKPQYFKGPFTLQTGLNTHSNWFTSMRVRTSSIRFRVFTLLQTHKCKAILVTWPLRQGRMTITVRAVPVKMAILSKIVWFGVTPLSWSWTFAWPHMLTRALVWPFVQPAIFTSLDLRDLSTYK